MKRMQKMFTYLMVLLGAATLSIVIFAGRNAPEKESEAVQETPAAANSAASAEVAESASESGEVPGWLLYENENENGAAKFRLDYPEGWTVKEEKDNYGNGVVGLIAPQAADGNRGTSDILIRFSSSVAEDSVNQANGWGATTLLQLIAKDAGVKKTGETEVGGSKAVEFISVGDGQSYGLFIEKSGHLYRIVFPGCTDPDRLSEEEKQILSSFEAE